MQPTTEHIAGLKGLVRAATNELERCPDMDKGRCPAFHALRGNWRNGYSWIFNNLPGGFDGGHKALMTDCVHLIVRFADFCPACDQKLPSASTT